MLRNSKAALTSRAICLSESVSTLSPHRLFPVPRGVARMRGRCTRTVPRRPAKRPDPQTHPARCAPDGDGGSPCAFASEVAGAALAFVRAAFCAVPSSVLVTCFDHHFCTCEHATRHDGLAAWEAAARRGRMAARPRRDATRRRAEAARAGVERTATRTVRASRERWHEQRAAARAASGGTPCADPIVR
jgi:hypothetical protein